MRRNILLLTIGLVTAGASPVRAQGGLTLTPHQRIRVTAPPVSPRRMEGVFTGQRGDTLLMLRENFPNQPQSTLIPFHAIERLEVRGRRLPSAGAWRGFWIGAIAGGLLGALVDPGSADLPGDRKHYVLGGALGMGLIGALIGLMAPGEGWRVVPL